MKKIIVSLIYFFVASLASIASISAQNVVMTFTAGVSPQQTPTPNHIIVNRSSQDEFTFDLAQVKASYFIGAGAKYNLNPFFVTAEALYNRREYVYNVENTFPGFSRTVQTTRAAENMNIVNVPVSLGVNLGKFDVTSGFIPQIVLSQDSDLSNIEGYSEKIKPVRYGWHSGLAYNLNELRIGLSYQMDFNNYADHIYINDQNLELQGQSNRILGTLSYQF